MFTLDLEPQIEPQIVASLNWMPYRYRNDQWQTFPLGEYTDKLTVDLQAAFAANDPDSERPAEVAVMQGAFLAAINGTSRVVEYQGQLLTADEQNDAEITSNSTKILKPFAAGLRSAGKQLLFMDKLVYRLSG